MSSLALSLSGLGYAPAFLGENNSFYSFLSRSPFSKITCPHYSSFLLPKEIHKQKYIFHGFANLNLDFFFSKKSSVKKVLTVHDLIPLLAEGQTSKLSTLQFKLFFKKALEAADAVVCVSSWTKETIEDFFPSFSSKLLIVENGYRKSEMFFIRPEKKDGNLRLLSVSRFEAYKNFSMALKVLQENPDFHLSFVTDKKGASYLNEKKMTLNLGERLSVYVGVGAHDLKALYESCDVFLTTSSYEGYGLPAFEALSRGLPVVFQRGHALESLLDKTLSVSLPPASSSVLWAESVLEARALSLAGGFKKNLKGFEEKRPSWDESAKKILSLYKDL